MFVLEDSGKLYCDRIPYKDTEEGLMECLATCEKVNGTDTGNKCTSVEDWGLSSYFAFAGLLALDTGHHLVSAFGDVWAPCTSRYFETSWPTYTFKTCIWIVTVAFTGLSIAVHTYVIDTPFLIVVPAANAVYLLSSLYVMSRDAKLRRAAAHMRAVVQVEHELLRIRQTNPNMLQNRHDIDARNELANRPRVERPSANPYAPVRNERNGDNVSFASQFQRQHETADDRMSRIAKGASIQLNSQAATVAKMGAPSGFGDTTSELVRMGATPAPEQSTRPISPTSAEGYLAVGEAAADNEPQPASAATSRQPSMAGSSMPTLQGFPGSPMQRMPTVASYQGPSLAGF